jgi:hypothetical protein
MRFMISARMPTEKANANIKDGSFAQTIQSIMEELQPEAAYFTDVTVHEAGTSSSTWTTLPNCLPRLSPFLCVGSDDTSPSRDDS